MLKYRHTFTANGKFITWMYHLARNVSADHFKKNKKMGFNKSLDVWANKLSDTRTGEQDLEKEQEIELLQRALDRLPAEKREVLVLSRYQELKYEEIAKVMNCTESNVKVRVHRAFQELKSIFLKLTQEKKYEM
jgi:RNA polymerase sigma-70 factor (ECF subfamily)